MGSDLSDSCSVYPVKALRASFAALRPAVTGQSLRLEVAHAESGAFGQLGRMNLLLERSQLDRQGGLPLVRQGIASKSCSATINLRTPTIKMRNSVSCDACTFVRTLDKQIH